MSSQILSVYFWCANVSSMSDGEGHGRLAYEDGELVHKRLLDRDLVEVDVVDRVLQEVDDVVEFVDELIDVLSVEGSDEAPVEQVDDVVGDRVGLVLDLLGALPVEVEIAVLVHELPEDGRDLVEAARHGLEILAEGRFFRKQKLHRDFLIGGPSGSPI